jgi:chlorite dismutase
MDEHIATGHRYPGVKINTTYSFGLDDQEFVVAFESDSAAEFLDLVHEMRSSEASTHTVKGSTAVSTTSSGLGRAHGRLSGGGMRSRWHTQSARLVRRILVG